MSSAKSLLSYSQNLDGVDEDDDVFDPEEDDDDDADVSDYDDNDLRQPLLLDEADGIIKGTYTNFLLLL